MPNCAASSSARIKVSFARKSSSPIPAEPRHHEIQHAAANDRRRWRDPLCGQVRRSTEVAFVCKASWGNPFGLLRKVHRAFSSDFLVSRPTYVLEANQKARFGLNSRGSLPSCIIDRNARAVMGQTAHRYLIFETAGGFCGIAWNDVGITRFQLPAKSAEAAERALLRRAPVWLPSQ